MDTLTGFKWVSRAPDLAFGFEEAALGGQALRAVFGCWEPTAIASAEMGMVTDPEQLKARRLAPVCILGHQTA